MPILCKHCGRPIEEILDPWGGFHGWHHPDLAVERDVYEWDYKGREALVARQFAVTSCGDEYGTEAEPKEGI